MTSETPPGERRLRTRIAVSATATLLGMLLSVSDARWLGGWLTMGALVMLLASLHRFGRQGPDAA